jgi:Ni,Fe-hydrogenase III component G
VVVAEDRIRSAMETAGSDAFELHRELRVVLGQAWDDELEPFRQASGENPVIWLHKVG